MQYIEPKPFENPIQKRNDYLINLRREQEQLDEEFDRSIEAFLSPEIIKLFNKYTSFYYQEIANYLLRPKKNNIIIEHHIDVISNTIKLYNIPTNLTIYRGTSMELFQKMNEINDNNFKSKAFVSTTISKEVCDQFKMDLLLKIDIPEGYNALWVEPLSSNYDEQEILLPIGTEFDVQNFSTIKENYKELNIIEAKVKTR